MGIENNLNRKMQFIIYIKRAFLQQCFSAFVFMLLLIASFSQNTYDKWLNRPVTALANKA